ncbi:MAG: histidine kinase [Xanthobacteraceae bacterium]|nr:histidine kinase [Xanthobacteraceae bacterium]QYK45333.1 MAG: histidine kinase [Xanthobacteraceae bacterium]
MSDISQFPRADWRTAKAEPQMAAIIRAIPEPALLLRFDGAVLAGNAAADVALGAVRVGSPVSLTVRAPEIVEAVREVGGGGAARLVSFNLRVPHDRAFDAHITPIGLEESFSTQYQIPGYILVVFRDRTEAMRVDQMRADFVANASHELRTPLASLAGFIDTLRGPARDDPAMREKFLGIMAEQARRMSRLIDDLLSLSRIELNAHVLPETVVDLNPIAAHVRDSLSPLARERGVEVTLETSPGQLLVRGERDDLIRLVENLVENALKYGVNGKRVEITLSSDNAEAVISVRDFGPGIAPEHLPRLTERFYRVDVAHSREQGGTGLGLALVKHIVARHRGRLSIESEPGSGATFIVRIPLSTAERR